MKYREQAENLEELFSDGAANLRLADVQSAQNMAIYSP